MRQIIAILVGVFSVSLFLSSPAHSAKCPKDSQRVGRWCVDRYEASVWATRDKRTINKIKKGTIADTTQLVGTATQYGATIDDYGPGCPDAGDGCTDFYAVSIPGVLPARFITWFQAVAACRNADKELLPNHVWQAAALGTPDMGGADNGATTCNTDNLEPGVAGTGSRPACISDVEVFDMAGNVAEWVADWVPLSTGGILDWEMFSDDTMSLVGASPTAGPGALIRGGNFGNFTGSGIFSVSGGSKPSASGNGAGFRCGR